MKDSGRFKIENDSVEIKGNLSVTVDAFSVIPSVAGEILVTNGKAEFGDNDDD